MEETSWHLDKKIPVALIVTLIGYGLLGTWWASKLQTQVGGHDYRIQSLEAASQKNMETQSLINERLGRIEERATASVQVLERIERQVAR